MRMTRRTPARWRQVLPGRDDPGEDGTLTAVLAVLFVVLLLSVALITRVQGDFHNVNLQTNLEQARANAQSGVADALFQIDQRDGSPGSFCSDPASALKTTCTVSSPPGAPKTIYTVRWNSDNESYTVLSQGEAHGVRYDVQAVIAAQPAIGNGLTGSTVTFNGKSDGSFYVTDSHGEIVTNAKANVAVATGGSMTCNGPSGGNAQYVPYVGYLQLNGCTPVVSPKPTTTYQPQAPAYGCPPGPNPQSQPVTPCLPTTGSQPCNDMVESNGTSTGGDSTPWVIKPIDASNPVMLKPGTYYCYGGLTLGGSSSDVFEPDYMKTGPVKIFVFGYDFTTNAVAPGSATDLSIIGQINPCKSPPTGCVAQSVDPTSKDVVGNPVRVQIYVGGSASTPSNIMLGSGPSCTPSPSCSLANAILWAPDSSLVTNGKSDPLTWTGALILGNMTINGSPQMTFFYDERVATDFQATAFHISSYYQIPPSQFTVPNF